MTKRPAGTAQARTALRTQRVIDTHHTQPLLAAMTLFRGGHAHQHHGGRHQPCPRRRPPGPHPGRPGRPGTDGRRNAASSGRCPRMPMPRGQDVKVMNLERNKEK